jgi:hypothetical protein
VFGKVYFRTSELWLNSLPDTLPSFDIMVLEADWWRRLCPPAVSTGYSSLGLLSRKVCEIIDDFLKFFWNGIISNFVPKIKPY